MTLAECQQRYDNMLPPEEPDYPDDYLCDDGTVNELYVLRRDEE